MTKLNLWRQRAEDFSWPELVRMRDELEELIRSDFSSYDDGWKNIVDQIISFQADDGSFNLLDTFCIGDEDACVDFCFAPTYICAAILMKAVLLDGSMMDSAFEDAIRRAMLVCCERNLEGHGYDADSGLLEAIRYFASGDVKMFLAEYPDICPQFSSMMKEMPERLAVICSGNGSGSFPELEDCLNYFELTPVFVYGTLMKGKTNHSRFISDEWYQGEGWLDGYEMFDLGCFPGIVKGNGTVPGEVYLVPDDKIAAIDRLEGEGSLYIKKPLVVQLENDKHILAYTYVYNRSIEGYGRLSGRYGENDYVWYVSYGSNLFEERLTCYIQGGYCKYNGKTYDGLDDKTAPAEKKPIMLPFNMYYSNYDKGTWKNSAVAFLDINRPGRAYGRAYKIKREQLEGIHAAEGRYSTWYPLCIRLADIDGIEAYTFAGNEKQHQPFFRVSAEYGYVLYKGMKETYPKMSDDEIWQYLHGCGE